MEYSLSQAFRHKEVKDVRVFISEASFFLGTLKTEILIRLYVKPEDENTIYYEQSHFLRTPLQNEPRSTSANFADSKEEAFHDAVSSLTDAYDIAVMAGHRPSDDWLIPNKFF